MEVIKSILHRLGFPGHGASVYEQNHDTGYPGLTTSQTVVELSIGRSPALNRVHRMLIAMGFRVSESSMTRQESKREKREMERYAPLEKLAMKIVGEYMTHKEFPFRIELEQARGEILDDLAAKLVESTPQKTIERALHNALRRYGYILILEPLNAIYTRKEREE